MTSFPGRFCLSVCLLITTSLFIRAEVRLPHIISSNMVLQRNQELRIWGWADRWEKVTVHLNEAVESKRADKDGRWLITLPAMEAGGPYTMKVRGKNIILLENILIGDVWVCSGQSNMEYRVEAFPWAEEEASRADFPEIRLFTVPKNTQLRPAEEINGGEWLECNPETVLPFSAVGYFFGRHIHKETGVPVGLLNTSWGGTNIETWTSGESIGQVPEFSEQVAGLADYTMEEEIDGRKAEMKETIDKYAAAVLGPNSHPTLLFNGMIHPILNFRVRGAIWYQGESNASRAFQYRGLFPLMIEDWRKQWEYPDMPFLFVQLANFMEASEDPDESAWAELREAQSMALALPGTGMAVAIDIGEADDIHPIDKQDVGKRLALAALHVAYGKDLVYSGPVFRDMVMAGNQAILSFDHIGSGLVARDRYGYLKGFAIAGEARIFHWARARIQGDKVIVSSEKVPQPVAVRYGWADNPDDVNLYNAEGLPASPFRTDDWPGVTQGRK